MVSHTLAALHVPPALTAIAVWVELGGMNARLLTLVPALLMSGAHAAEPAQAPWPVAGQQGLVRYVIVPTAQARDEAAYAQQLALLCEPERTCFVNFYTNSTGAPLGMPLPDAIDHEATAVFRQSVKRGAATLRWACRMQIATETCF